MNKRQPDPLTVLFDNFAKVFGREAIKDEDYEAAENYNQAQQAQEET